MATTKLEDIPRGPARFRENRKDPKEGEGPFVGLVNAMDAELVTPNGLVWNGDHMGRVFSEPSTNPWPRGDRRHQGNRADMVSLGGNTTVNQIAPDIVVKPGNRSGE
jgi:hypothetical protein